MQSWRKGKKGPPDFLKGHPAGLLPHIMGTVEPQALGVRTDLGYLTGSDRGIRTRDCHRSPGVWGAGRSTRISNMLQGDGVLLLPAQDPCCKVSDLLSRSW